MEKYQISKNTKCIVFSDYIVDMLKEAHKTCVSIVIVAEMQDGWTHMQTRRGRLM